MPEVPSPSRRRLPPFVGLGPGLALHRLDEDELSNLVMQATAAELELLLVHPRVNEKHAALAIANKSVSAQTLQRIGDDRRFTRGYEVKRALVEHPRTPRHLAIRFVKFLYLADLLRLLDSHQIAPGLKRFAESTLVSRMPQITLGERLTMAKGGGRGVVKVLKAEQDEIVLRALLQNPKLTSSDVVHLIESGRTPPSLLEDIGTSARWKVEYAVRFALARNPAPRARSRSASSARS
ncbi:MAG: hypothetical protein U0166_14100 [Acidobacteriota bacterium]